MSDLHSGDLWSHLIVPLDVTYLTVESTRTSTERYNNNSKHTNLVNNTNFKTGDLFAKRKVD